MKKLFKNKKGFTLMEMLIVVAIIVILVSVSMPIFSNKVDDARKAADDANLRAAKAAAVAQYLTDADAQSESGLYYYNATDGKLYGNSNQAGTAYGQSKDNRGCIVKITYGTDGSIKAEWFDVTP